MHSGASLASSNHLQPNSDTDPICGAFDMKDAKRIPADLNQKINHNKRLKIRTEQMNFRSLIPRLRRPTQPDKESDSVLLKESRLEGRITG